MPLRFTIIDRTVNPNGVNTVIDEPVGWDGIGMRLNRHKEWHGFIDFFDDVEQSLQFDGEGFYILKNAFDGHGVEARVNLLIEYACSDTDAYEQVYNGNFVFARYHEFCTDRCYAEIGL